MSYEKRADYEAQWLFPPSFLEDLLGKSTRHDSFGK
jgi:hypothetical protein